MNRVQIAIRGSKIKIMEFHLAELTAWDLPELRLIKIHKQFSDMPEREIPVKDLFLTTKYGSINANFPGLS